MGDDEKRKELKKIIFEEGGQVKVIRGYILEVSDFWINVECQRDGAIFTIGKRAIIRISDIKGDGY